VSDATKDRINPIFCEVSDATVASDIRLCKQTLRAISRLRKFQKPPLPQASFNSWAIGCSCLFSGNVRNLLQPDLRQPGPHRRVVHQGLRKVQDSNLRTGETRHFYIFEKQHFFPSMMTVNIQECLEQRIAWSNPKNGYKHLIINDGVGDLIGASVQPRHLVSECRTHKTKCHFWLPRADLCQHWQQHFYVATPWPRVLLPGLSSAPFSQLFFPPPSYICNGDLAECSSGIVSTCVLMAREVESRQSISKN
jgi:hypothetical protein